MPSATFSNFLVSVLVTLFIIRYVNATQSVFSCPITPGFRALGMAPGMGQICGTGSFLHYWNCCEYSPFECCFQFETWAIVFFSVVLVVFLSVGLFVCGRYIFQRYW